MPKNILKDFNHNNLESRKQTTPKVKHGEFSSLMQGKIPSNVEFAAALSQAMKDNSDKDGTDLAYRKAAKEFEKETLAIMWNIMASTVEVDPLFGGGGAEELFRSELNTHRVHDAYASQDSKLVEDIYKSLKRREKAHDKGKLSEGGN
ncbi:MAG: hypothetical protein K0R02_26 [Rickettsiaceae bacterium]|jgi:hypothetical protein|nr:hypothetical protein [Rickettsiaceae bacterium]